MTSGPRRALGAAVRATGMVTWLGLAVAGTLAWILPEGPAGSVDGTVALVAVPSIFLLMLLRLGLALPLADRSGRVRLLGLGGGLFFWAAGSAVLNVYSDSGRVVSPGEALFLIAYLGFGVYLLRAGADTAGSSSANSWLEAVIICGGAASLGGVALVLPASHNLGGNGLDLLIALLYPLLDLSLIMLVLAQIALHWRQPTLATAQVLAGLGLLALADSSMAVDLRFGSYGYGPIAGITWMVAFMLLVGHACRTPRPDEDATATVPSDGVDRHRGALTLLASGFALVALVLQPGGSARPFVVVPAVLTLVTAGLRLQRALRQARGAAEAYRLSRTDDLTDLPNRRALAARLTDRLAGDGPLALLLLDLDGFKEINDSLGHSCGDTMLRIVATRLGEVMGETAFISRLGGDEFAVVVDGDDEFDLLGIADRLALAIRRPARVDGLQLRTGVSIGVATRTAEVRTGGDLLRRADVAMYQAKTGGGGALLYDSARDEFSRQRLRTAEELRRGIESDQLQVWYQPQVEAATGRVCAVEALVRWMHPREGLCQPDTFLPIARRSGLMAALTEAVFAQVVVDARRWHGQGLGLHVAVNVAPAELLDEVVLGHMLQQVTRAGLPRDSVIVEVTEDSFLAEPERARAAIENLRLHGVQASIDDYGMGYSSLSYLRDLPVQELKIDRTFVADLLTDPRSRMIVSTTTQLAHGLGLRTVAEGVEDEALTAELVGMGVDLLQGYHFARPMPGHEVAAWVLARQPQSTKVS